jgi:UrcA family protein
MIRHISVIGAALAVLFMAQSASAGSERAVSVNRMVVPFGDLNLGTAEGQSTLQSRIDAAAAKVCGGDPVFSGLFRTMPPDARAKFEKCRMSARHEAIARLNQLGVSLR